MFQHLESQEKELMFGNLLQTVDLIKTCYFATGPEIASRLCVSSVCMPVYLYVCVGRTMGVFVSVCYVIPSESKNRLLSQVLYVRLKVR